MSERLYKAVDFRKLIAVSDRTLYDLEYSGKLIPKRINNRRYYTQSQLDEFIGSGGTRKEKRNTIVYSRVSSKSQKAELENQQKILEMYVTQSGKIADMYLSDIGSGINFNRPNFLKIVEMVIRNEVDEIIITYKDRLTRFGFELIEHLCKLNGTTITVMNLQSTTPQEELVEDLMAIIHVFSERLSGLRQYKTKLKKMLVKEDPEND